MRRINVRKASRSFNILIALFLNLAIALPSASAWAVTLVGTTSNPTALDGLVVDGAIYNVTFLTGVPYKDAYPLGSPPPFYGNQTGASDAAAAITAAFNDFGVHTAWGDVLIPYSVNLDVEDGAVVTGFPSPDFRSDLYQSVNDEFVVGNFEHYTQFAQIRGAVPETSTWAMMLLGFAGLGLMAYRRRAQPVTA
jgi:hypothetical protein